MKLCKRFSALLLIITVSLTLFACSSPLELGGYEAVFQGHMVELNGEYAALSDIYPGENYLELYEDGTGVISFSDMEEDITWTGADSTFSIVVQGEPCSATFEDGILRMELEGAYVTYVAEGASAPEIPATEATNYDTNPYTAYGKYNGLTINQYGQITEMTEFYSGKCYISLEPDGMGVLCLGGSELIIAWELDGQTLTIADTNGYNSYGIVDYGVLVLDYMETGLELAFAKEGFEP